jgi:hypothetical protein
MRPSTAAWVSVYAVTLALWGVALGLVCATFVPGTFGVRGIGWRRDRGMVNDPGVHRDNLYSLDDAMRAVDMFYWIGEGTALGAVREGDIIVGDSDVDIGIRADDEERFMKEVVPRLQRVGFSILRRRPLSLVRADERGEGYIDVDVTGPGRRCMAIQWPRPCEPIMDVLEPFREAQVGGRSFRVPSEQYIERLYGTDWMIPKHGFKPRHVNRGAS